MDFYCSPAQLEGFATLCRTRSVSKAAKELHITQPTLSLRLKALEELLQCTLFRRDRRGIVLTTEGERLFVYIQHREDLDRDYLEDFVNQESLTPRMLSLAGHYSIIQNVVIPALAPFLREQPRLQLTTVIREDDELPDILSKGVCDFVFLQHPYPVDGFDSVHLGSEEYVLVESSKFKTRQDVYIDSDPTDSMTANFFAIQQERLRPKRYFRSFLSNETGIVQAVALGLGRAVVARSEISKSSSIRICKGFKPFKLNSYLCYQRRKYESKMRMEVLPVIIQRCRKHLA